MISRVHPTQFASGNGAPRALHLIDVVGRAARRRQAVSVAAFGVALACFGSARAQTSQLSMPSGTDRFTLDARGGVAYDSNVSGGNTSIATLRQLQPEDVTYTLGTSAAFQLPSSRQTLFVDASADFQRHQNNSVLDADDYSVTAGIAERLGLCSATGIAGYSRRQSQIQDLAIAATKNTATQEAGSVGVTCGRRAIFVQANGNVTRVTNDALQSGFVNSTTENASVGAGYRNDRLGDLSITGQYSNIDYPPDPVLGTSTPSVQEYGAGLSYSRKIGLRLSGSAGVSYNIIQGGITHTSSDGLNANASLAYRLSSRTQFTLDYNLGNSASPLMNTSYVRSETIQITGSYSLTKRVSFHASASRAKQDYRGIQQIVVLQLRQSTTDQFGGGVDVKIGRKASVSLTATYTDRVADVPQFNYSDDRIAVTLSNRF
jgi:predicted porin